MDSREANSRLYLGGVGGGNGEGRMMYMMEMRRTYRRLGKEGARGLQDFEIGNGGFFAKRVVGGGTL